MKRLAIISLLTFLIACDSASSDADNQNTRPMPTLSISAGLDPFFAAQGDSYGALASAAFFPHLMPLIFEQDPDELDPYLFSPLCGFLGGGLELGKNGTSTFIAVVSAEGSSASAAVSYRLLENNTKISYEFDFSSSTAIPDHPPEECAAQGTYSGLSGLHPLGSFFSTPFHVVDIYNDGERNVELVINWTVEGEGAGSPDEADWGGYFYYYPFRTCEATTDYFPNSFIFDYEDITDTRNGSYTINMGNLVRSQVILDLDIDAASSAQGPCHDIPPTQGSSRFSGKIDFQVRPRN